MSLYWTAYRVKFLELKKKKENRKLEICRKNQGVLYIVHQLVIQPNGQSRLIL